MMAFLKLLARNRLALAGGIVLSFVVLLALITPLLPLAEPNVTNTAARFQKPFSEGTLLGTDHLGRDLLSRLMWGTRLSLAVGFAAAVVAATLGAAIGIGDLDLDVAVGSTASAVKSPLGVRTT